jgi:hypothetical protein
MKSPHDSLTEGSLLSQAKIGIFMRLKRVNDIVICGLRWKPRAASQPYMTYES